MDIFTSSATGSITMAVTKRERDMKNRRIFSLAAVLTLTVGSMMLTPAAQADSSASCSGFGCSVVDSTGGQESPGSAAQNENSAKNAGAQSQIVPTDTGASTSPQEQRCTTSEGREIPCTRDDGWWYPAEDCYVTGERLNIRSEDLNTHSSGPEGSVMSCYSAPQDGKGLGEEGDLASSSKTVFVPDAAAAEHNPPAKSGAQLAHEVIAAHEFEKFSIASLPADASDALYTKAHLWLWVPEGTQARAAGTGTPIVEEKSEGPTRVKVKYELVGVNVDFAGGDPARGAHVQCHGVGDVNTAKSALKPSPSCSYQPRVHGTYRVSGSTLWRVSWESSDASGVMVHEVPLEAKDIRVVDAAAKNTKP